MSEDLTTPQVLDDIVDRKAPDFKRTAKDITAGTVSGIAQVLVGQPFDITKVRLQTAHGDSSAFQVIRSLVKNEGPLAFYKGTLAPLVGIGACVSCQFGCNEAMKRYFHLRNGGGENRTLTLPQYYMCGATSGAANAFLATPIEHVRIRMQLQTKALSASEYTGSFDCFKKLLNQGVLMRGFTPTLMRTSHGFGMYFLTYEALINTQIHQGIKREDVATWKVCGFGAISGALFWAMTYPIDVVKSVMQADKLQLPTHGNNVIEVAKTIYRTRGPSAFLKGFAPTMLRSLPVNGATFATFEVAMRILA